MIWNTGPLQGGHLECMRFFHLVLPPRSAHLEGCSGGHALIASAPVRPARARAGADAYQTSQGMVKDTLRRPSPWKSPCRADHRARSGHSSHGALHATAVVYRRPPVVRSLPPSANRQIADFERAYGLCLRIPSHAHSGDGHTRADAHVETRPATADTTTQTCAAATPTSGPCWSGPLGLCGLGPVRAPGATQTPRRPRHRPHRQRPVRADRPPMVETTG